jgi:hypothetical protein
MFLDDLAGVLIHHAAQCILNAADDRFLSIRDTRKKSLTKVLGLTYTLF